MLKVALLLCAIAFAGALASPASIKSDLTRLIHDVEALEGTTDAQQAALQTSAGDGEPKVVAVFDVGSSGTKVVFGATEEDIPDANNADKVKLESDNGAVKGLAAVVSQPNIVGFWAIDKVKMGVGAIKGPEEYMKLLFKEVHQDLEGIHQAPSTGTYVINMMATAGMRKVSKQANDDLWSKVCGNELKIGDVTYKTPEKGLGKEACGTIPGTKEAYFEWYALNLAHKGTNMFSMGGASAQVAAAVPKELFDTWRTFIQTADHTGTCNGLTTMKQEECCDRKTFKKKSGEQMMTFSWCKDTESFDGSFANDYKELTTFNGGAKALDFVGALQADKIPNFSDLAGFDEGGLILISYLGIPHKIEDPDDPVLDGGRKDNFFVGGLDTFELNIYKLEGCKPDKNRQDCKKAIATAFCKDELYEQTVSFFRKHKVYKHGKWMAITNVSPGRVGKPNGYSEAVVDIDWPENDRGKFFSVEGYTQSTWADAISKLDENACSSSKNNPPKPVKASPSPSASPTPDPNNGSWGKFDETCMKAYARLFYWGGFMAPKGLKGIGGGACKDMATDTVSLDGVKSGSWAGANDWTIGSASISAGGKKIFQKELAVKGSPHPRVEA